MTNELVILGGARTAMAEHVGTPGFGEFEDVTAMELGAQDLACEKVPELDRSKCNVNGGAVALGHPLGATGTRPILTLVRELRERRERFGVASACIGGGQGIAAVAENPGAK